MSAMSAIHERPAPSWCIPFLVAHVDVSGGRPGCANWQERLTHQLADEVASASRAAGVLVVVEARHLCMVARGVEKHAAGTTTIACRGTLADDTATRAELMLGCCVAL